MAAYGAIMALMYPIMVENNALMTQYMETFPQEFLAAFGMTGSLSDPGVFYTTYISSWLWPIMAAVVALLLGTRVAADLDRGFLDLPLATPMSRVRYLAASVVGQAVAMAVLAGRTVGGVWVDRPTHRRRLRRRPLRAGGRAVVAVRVRDRGGDHAARRGDAEPGPSVGDRGRRARRRCTSSSSWSRSAPTGRGSRP